MHPMKMADRGGTAPYCLGAAQLEAGKLSSEIRGSLPPSGATPGAMLYANRAMAYNRCCVNEDGEAGVSSPGVEVGLGD